jgi:hypothetical protein
VIEYEDRRLHTVMNIEELRDDRIIGLPDWPSSPLAGQGMLQAVSLSPGLATAALALWLTRNWLGPAGLVVGARG